MKKRTYTSLRLVCCLMIWMLAWTGVSGQQSGSITVGGNINTFYPVTWYDGGWSSNKQTELHIGRSSVHTNSQWRGSIIATFHFHTNNWGNQSHFINAHIVNSTSSNSPFQGFVAGWTGEHPSHRAALRANHVVLRFPQRQ